MAISCGKSPGNTRQSPTAAAEKVWRKGFVCHQKVSNAKKVADGRKWRLVNCENQNN